MRLRVLSRQRPPAIGIGMLLLGVMVPTHPSAQDLDPNTCFCLRHDTNQFRRNCAAVKGPQDFYTTAACKDPESGRTAETLITKPWTIVKEGEPGCEICRPPSSSRDNVIRGPEDSKQSSSK
jgi:hypothetical protein